MSRDSSALIDFKDSKEVVLEDIRNTVEDVGSRERREYKKDIR